MTVGVILSTRSLVLQRVARQDAGSYTCRAANARGETVSQPVRLRVQCEYKYIYYIYIMSSSIILHILKIHAYI